MGRIDEALRRSGGEPTDSSPAIPREEVFTSPWSGSAPIEAKLVPAPGASKSDSGLLGGTPDTVFLRFDPRWYDLLTISPNADAFLTEQFRRLAGQLHNAQSAGRMKVVLITSAGAGDGKTLSAMNLALILSESYGRRVLLVDGDLRRPSIHQICGFRDLPGLSDGLKSHRQEKLAVIQVSKTLSLLPGGRPDSDPMNALSSDRMRAILAEAAERFDWVIIDTPPIGLVPDASLLAGMADTVLFVVRAGKTQFKLVTESIETIGRDRIFGVLLNAIDKNASMGYPAYYTSYLARLPTR